MWESESWDDPCVMLLLLLSDISHMHLASYSMHHLLPFSFYHEDSHSTNDSILYKLHLICSHYDEG